jgi:hypothetical protein
MMIKALPTLEMIGVYNCTLLHIGHLPTLLDILGEHANGTDKHITLDFYPQFHVGSADMRYRKGAYGVSWKSIGMQAQIGIAKILMESHLKAHVLGLNLLERGTGLRRWLDKLPARRNWVPILIDAISNLKDWCVNGSQLSMPQRRTLLAEFFAAAVYGIKKLRWNPPRVSDRFWEISSCSVCKYRMSDVLFSSRFHGHPPDNYVCQGCELRCALSAEKDHMKPIRRRAISLMVPGHNPDGTRFELQMPENIVFSRNSDQPPRNLSDNEPRMPGCIEGLPTIQKLGRDNDAWILANDMVAEWDHEILFQTGAPHSIKSIKNPAHPQDGDKEERPDVQLTTARACEYERRDATFKEAYGKWLAGREGSKPEHESNWLEWPEKGYRVKKGWDISYLK